jgi:predicted nucleic acid-binding protein
LILDANILIRAVLGSRVLWLLTAYGEHTDFFAPDTAFDEAIEHLPAILRRRGINAAPALAILEALREVVQTVEPETYSNFESGARERLIHRDQDDWPILATALALRCPIWTEDTDFFGCGVPTWTSDRVEIYLKLPLAPTSD